MVTKLQLKGLAWIAAREPIGWFDVTAPTLAMRRLLEKGGLIERVAGRDPGTGWGLVCFQLTAAGRQALQEKGENR